MKLSLRAIRTAIKDYSQKKDHISAKTIFLGCRVVAANKIHHLTSIELNKGLKFVHLTQPNIGLQIHDSCPVQYIQERKSIVSTMNLTILQCLTPWVDLTETSSNQDQLDIIYIIFFDKIIQIKLGPN